MNSANKNNPAAAIFADPACYVSRFKSYDEANRSPACVRIFYVGAECWTTASDETASILRAAGHHEGARRNPPVIHTDRNPRPSAHWAA